MPKSGGAKPKSHSSDSVHKGLDSDIIVGAARRIARKGLSELTMGSLAEELGVTPMAPYRHVRNKEHLVQLLFDSVLSEVSVPPRSVGDWVTRLRTLHRDVNRAMNRYPGLTLAPQPLTENANRLLEGYLDILLDAGFDECQAVQAYTGLYYLAMGTVTDAERAPVVTPAARPPVHPEATPATARVAPVAAALRRPEYHDAALEIYLAGLRALLDSDRTRRRATKARPAPNRRGAPSK